MKFEDLENLRKKELVSSTKTVILFVAIPTVLLAIYLDYLSFGFRWSWFLFRLGIIPVGVISILLFRVPFVKRYPGLPIAVIAIYVDILHCIIIGEEANGSRIYANAFIQVLFGLTLIPVTIFEFLLIGLITVGSFVIMVASNLREQDIEIMKVYWLYLPLILFSFLVVRRIRTSLYIKTLEQESELLNRNQIIEQQVGLITASRADLIKKDSEIAGAKKLGDLAAQVAHDIRSPLSALNIATENLNDIGESQRILVRYAIRRITDIANNLLTYKRKIQKISPRKNTPFMITSVLGGIVSEKRLQYRLHKVAIDIYINQTNYGQFVSIDVAEFARVISNLINNSIEASCTTIQIDVRENSDQIIICLKDNGIGIAHEIVSELGRSSITTKKDGSGLGLIHARQAVEAAGGMIKFSVQNGTFIEIFLPKAHPPKWFLKNLKIESDMNVVILDDDQPIHDLWANRLCDKTKNIFHFLKATELAKWISNESRGLFLFDYELRGQDTNGLDLILKFEIQESSVLVTNHYDEEELIEKCLTNNIRMMPKEAVAYIPINAG